MQTEGTDRTSEETATRRVGASCTRVDLCNGGMKVSKKALLCLALAAGVLFLASAQSARAQRISAEARGGVALHSGELNDLVKVGGTLGLGVAYHYHPNFAVRVDAQVDLLAGERLDSGATAPDMKLWRLTGGLEAIIPRPQYQDVPFTLALHVGAGATRFEVDEFVVLGETRDLSEIYPTLNAGASLGYEFSRNVNAFVSGQAYLMFADEQDTEIFDGLSSEVQSFDLSWSFPLSFGVRVTLP